MGDVCIPLRRAEDRPYRLSLSVGVNEACWGPRFTRRRVSDTLVRGTARRRGEEQSAMDSTDRLNGAGDTGSTGGAASKTDSSARRRFSITITTRTLLLGAALGTVVLVGIVLFTHALGTLIALLLAIILGEAIRPVVAWLHGYRIPSAVAILLIYLVGAIIAGLLIWLLLNPLISQINTLT